MAGGGFTFVHIIMSIPIMQIVHIKANTDRYWRNRRSPISDHDFKIFILGDDTILCRNYFSRQCISCTYISNYCINVLCVCVCGFFLFFCTIFTACSITIISNMLLYALFSFNCTILWLL